MFSSLQNDVFSTLKQLLGLILSDCTSAFPEPSSQALSGSIQGNVVFLLPEHEYACWMLNYTSWCAATSWLWLTNVTCFFFLNARHGLRDETVNVVKSSVFFLFSFQAWRG